VPQTAFPEGVSKTETSVVSRLVLAHSKAVTAPAHMSLVKNLDLLSRGFIFVKALERVSRCQGRIHHLRLRPCGPDLARQVHTDFRREGASDAVQKKCCGPRFDSLARLSRAGDMRIRKESESRQVGRIV
jgi:hypothetical protein